jgi:hypothetical protein
MRWIIALAFMMAAQLAAAQDEAVPPEILACAPIQRSSERLACFDRAVVALRSGKSQAVASPLAAPEAMFGINSSAPAVEKKGAQEDRTQVDQIVAKVVKVRPGQEGVILELDNEQTWKQTHGSSNLLLKAGDEIKITRGAFNSFNLSTPSGRGAKVKRIN